ncbi:hypothetical protein [Apibacter sp.]|uniref:hypothetical protein n=1 Tax=Apibacter sp. TaxID=2023709 RepID=UPI0025DE788D|nr:hypothetical protein [Apibacter sp.]MCT6870162.1 hypothetical protein [Apibacter sp.]
MSKGKIIRIIGGESVKKAKKSITLTATKGDLTFNSPQKVLMNGKQSGVLYLNNYKPPLPLRVVKLDGPYDGQDKKVDIIKDNIQYIYKVIQFNRIPKKSELKDLKWATQFDDGELYTDHPISKGNKKVSFKISGNSKKTRFTVYAYFKKPSEKVSVTNLIEGKYPKLYISTQKTGYTIQKLYGHPAATSALYTYEPAVVVSTYRAYLRFFENGETKDIIEFNVTRDAWYYLGEKNGKAHLLNRTFEPLDGNKNLYYTEEVKFPSKAPNDCKGYFLMQNKSRTIKAEPFETQIDINGISIGDKRKQPNKAHNVMLHIGGVYRLDTKGAKMQWLGGSLGCFAFIPANDIYQTKALAKKASKDDDYDDDTSNAHWLKITNKISELKNEDPSKRFYIIINKRSTWTKTKEIDSEEILHE